MRKTTCLFVLAMMVGIPTIVQAITITNETTNTLLFYDNFESAPSVSTGVAPDVDFHNPVALTGSYVFLQNAPALVVTNSTASPDPGPYEGDNYLRIYRSGPPYDEQEFQAVPTSTQSTVGDKIRMSMMVNAGSGSGNMIGGMFDGAGGIQGLVLAGVVNSGFISIYNGGWQNTGVPYIPGQWQRWDIDYVVGTAALTVTVDGNTGSAGIVSGGPFLSFRFWNANGIPASVYIDAIPGTTVPEPTTAVLLTSSMLGLLIAVRRNRR